jgi:GTPase
MIRGERLRTTADPILTSVDHTVDERWLRSTAAGAAETRRDVGSFVVGEADGVIDCSP